LLFIIFQAPEIGVYNDKFGWGGGIEQLGVNPDVEVDNNPRTSFDGKDTQMETAIAELKRWLEEEPIVLPRPPKHKKDMSMGTNECPAQ
jgi:tricorn protease